MLDVRGRTDSFLDGIDDALFDVERRGSFINDPNEGHRHLNLREEIDRQSLQRGGAQEHHGKGQHQDADTIAQCEEG